MDVVVWTGITFGVIALSLIMYMCREAYYTWKVVTKIRAHAKAITDVNKKVTSIKDFTLLMCKLKLMKYENAWLVEVNYLSKAQVKIDNIRKI